MSTISRKIIKHFTFWILFVLLWSLHDFNYHNDLLDNIKTNVVAFIPYVILVYFNLYFLMPKFLLKKKIAIYLLLLILSIITTTFIASKYLYFYFSQVNIYIPTAEFFNNIRGQIAVMTEIILSIGLSMTLFLTEEWYRKERSMREEEQKRLETELSLLKNQINPHFLFNSLNSIYVMMGKNLASGKEMLLQFSDILSHQLYETNKKNIALESELDNLINYINIEKIRYEDLVTVDYSFPERTYNLHISPMLLLPLVENAFKHGQSSQGCLINVKAEIPFGNTLSFKVENTISNSSVKNKNNKGIGLANVKRRLELIYPNRHLFNIEESSSKFTVHLNIQLNENDMFDR